MESNYVDVIPNHDFIGIFFVSSPMNRIKKIYSPLDREDIVKIIF